MTTSPPDKALLPGGRRVDPAVPLWRIAPTHADDGRSLADFMMLIPGLKKRPEAVRKRVAELIREVCESYDGQVAFADINYSINVLWVSVAAEPGLTGRVAQSIRSRVPDALLVGGQLGAVPAPLACAEPQGRRLWSRLRRLSRRLAIRLEGPSPP
jgi:hypothetical protein